MNNTSASGGEAQTGITTEADCLSQCATNNQCVGVDLDLTSGAATLCWFHLDQSNLANTNTRQGVHHFVLQERCPQGIGNNEILLKADGYGQFLYHANRDLAARNLCFLTLTGRAEDLHLLQLWLSRVNAKE